MISYWLVVTGTWLEDGWSSSPHGYIMIYHNISCLYNICLVGGLEHFLFFHILGMSSSQLTNSYFQRGRVETTNHARLYLSSGEWRERYRELPRVSQALILVLELLYHAISSYTYTSWRLQTYTWGYFQGHGDTPIAGWFTMENPCMNGWFKGTPIVGNLHMIDG